MIVDRYRHRLGCLLGWALRQMEAGWQRWTQPGGDRLLIGTLADLTRSRRDLIAENAFLRQQLIVLKRQKPRPRLTRFDRTVLLLLAAKVRGWKDSLFLVKPDTLLNWHRAGFRLFWRQKSQGKARASRISAEAIAFINEMAVNNRLWDSKRIRGELLKLGIGVNRRTVQRYMNQARRGLPPSQKTQTWATFIANHGNDVWACDFLQAYDVVFRSIFLFFIIELGSRRVVRVGVTCSPSDAWVAQQMREATPFGKGPRFLICDNDGKYGVQFVHVVEGAGIRVLHTRIAAPRANAICERLLGSVRRECLDHSLILSQRHLQRLATEYVTFYNQARLHQGLAQRIPAPLEVNVSVSHVGTPHRKCG
jgi:putative transposase